MVQSSSAVLHSHSTTIALANFPINLRPQLDDGVITQSCCSCPRGI